jgi:serine/threonine-protein kinase
VLLVDDQPDLRRLLLRQLTKPGHEVLAASSAQNAIDLVVEGDFDVIVTDVRMPDMDGVELLRALRAHDPDLPVLLVSGAPDLPTALKAVEHGAFEYLVRPVPADKMQESVARAIALRRQRVANRQLLDEYRSNERATPTVIGTERASWTGSTLGSRFRVGRLIGLGGMGAVYEAITEDADETHVALKVLHPDLAGDATLMARFRREADTISALNHPNIVKILDFRASEPEPAFIVMELLEGVSLRRALSEQPRMSAARIVGIASQMLSALAAVHQANVVHRDIKPDNVFLTSVAGADVVKLLDFGVAKVLDSSSGENLTQNGTVLGTPTYMAPEHARGAAVDPRSDIYSVAAIMYEALGGQPPFRGENYNALLFAIQQGRPTPLEELHPGLDPRLSAVIRRAMSVQPALRFQTADDMAEALERWLDARSLRP